MLANKPNASSRLMTTLKPILRRSLALVAISTGFCQASLAQELSTAPGDGGQIFFQNVGIFAGKSTLPE